MKQWKAMALKTFALIVCILLAGCSNTSDDRTSSIPVQETTEGVESVTREKSVEEDTEPVTEDQVSRSLNDVKCTIKADVLHIALGEEYEIPLDVAEENADVDSGEFRQGFLWTSDQPEIVSVDEYGCIRAENTGAAVISCENQVGSEQICINVYDEFGTGSRYEMEVLVRPDKTVNYMNYCQGGWDYDDKNEYIAWHGCAACCAATVLRAWEPEEDWTPDRWINELEKEEVPESWEKNYSKSMARQSPVTQNGIHMVFESKGLPHTFVSKLSDKAEEEIRDYLLTGEPVIYQAGRGGYHTMLLLGLNTEGDVLVSDPAGGYRVCVRSLEDVVDQMFSCKREPDHFYFSGRATAGGYIMADLFDD